MMVFSHASFETHMFRLFALEFFSQRYHVKNTGCNKMLFLNGYIEVKNDTAILVVLKNLKNQLDRSFNFVLRCRYDIQQACS